MLEKQQQQEEEEEEEESEMGRTEVFATRSRYFICQHVYRSEPPRERAVRVLKLDRTDPCAPLSAGGVVEDVHEYSHAELHAMLTAVSHGNRGGLQRICSCEGVIGAIRFLRGYYLVLCTRRERVATLLGHAVYAVAETRILPLASEEWFASGGDAGADMPQHTSVNTSGNNTSGNGGSGGEADRRGVFETLNADRLESRYRRLLVNVGSRLTKGFFYSETYALHRSLQRNQRRFDEPKTRRPGGTHNCEGRDAFRGKYTWNAYLAKPFVDAGFGHWLLSLVHGSVSQVRMAPLGFGKVVEVTLVSRRSRYFAGTRFLKRGINNQGYVANYVETEQLLEVEGEGKISSFVQCRGSVPLFWYQDSSPLSPKPDILLQRFDPLYMATSKHFRYLLNEYGGPVILLSLLKEKESRPREMILSNELKTVVEYFNWSLRRDSEHKRTDAANSDDSGATQRIADVPVSSSHNSDRRSARRNDVTARKDEQDLIFLPWDYNRYSKLRDRENVMNKLIAATAKQVDRIGIFVEGVRNQSGVLRTNCLDCLDRTNVAQYAAGLVAFGRQLHALGAKHSHEVDVGASASSRLMDMYQAMGNDLAHQYGGSEAHSAAFKEQRGEWKTVTQSKELLTSIRRFYSNSYSDAEKQDEVNLLLGLFVPLPGKLALWDLETDYYLHHPIDFRARDDDGKNDREKSDAHDQSDESNNTDSASSRGESNMFAELRVPRRMISPMSCRHSATGDRELGIFSLVAFFDDILASKCNRISEARLYCTHGDKGQVSPNLVVNVNTPPVLAWPSSSGGLPREDSPAYTASPATPAYNTNLGEGGRLLESRTPRTSGVMMSHHRASEWHGSPFSPTSRFTDVGVPNAKVVGIIGHDDDDDDDDDILIDTSAEIAASIDHHEALCDVLAPTSALGVAAAYNVPPLLVSSSSCIDSKYDVAADVVDAYVRELLAASEDQAYTAHHPDCVVDILC